MKGIKEKEDKKVKVTVGVKAEKKEKERKNINENKKDCDRILSRNSPMVSLFENFYSVKPIKQINLDKFLLTSRFKAQVEKYRACSDPEKRRLMKGDLNVLLRAAHLKKEENPALSSIQDCYALILMQKIIQLLIWKNPKR